MPTNPTLFIGVGGFGANLVRRVREKITHEFEGQQDYLNLFKYIIMDPVVDLPVNQERDVDGFERRDWVEMEGFTQGDLKRRLQRPAYRELNKRVDKKYRVSPPAINGYNQVRMNGAIGLSMSCEEGGLITSLRSAFADIKTYHHEAIEKEGGKILVMLCGSLCGGTGSGVMIDLGYLIKHLCSEVHLPVGVVGLLGQPELMARVLPEDATPRLYANAYAFWKELNWLMVEPSTRSQDQLRGFSYENKFRNVVIKENVDNETLWGPFAQAFFVSDHSETGTVLPSFQAAVDTAAEAVFIALKTGMPDQVMVNAIPGEPAENNYGEKRARIFGGFGSATIRFPAERVRDYLMAKATSSLLGDYVISPPGANAQGDLLFENTITDEKSPLEVDLVTNLVVSTRSDSVSGYQETINQMTPRKMKLHKLLSTVKSNTDASLEGSKGLRSQMQNTLSELRANICEKIDDEVEEIFSKEGNRSAVGIAAVFLYRMQTYCEEQAGLNQAGDEELAGFAAQATQLEQEIKQNYLNAKSSKLLEVEALYSKKKIPMIPSGNVKLYRQGVARLVNELRSKILQQAMYEELDEFYRSIYSHVVGLKRPIRFVQEVVATELRKEYAQPTKKLAKGNEAIGNIKHICDQESEIKRIVLPAITCLDSETGLLTEAALDEALVEFIPELERIIREVQDLVKDFGGTAKELDQFLLRHKARLVRKVEILLAGVVGDKIYKELEENCSLVDLFIRLAEDSGMEPGSEDVLISVRQRFTQLSSGIPRFSGFYRTRQKEGTVTTNGMVLNKERANAILMAYQSRYERKTAQNSFNVDNMVGDNGLHVANNCPCDVFTLSVFSGDWGHPLFETQAFSEAKEQYKRYLAKEKIALGLHTDKRYIDKSDEHLLPPVEMTDEDEGAYIFLFCLAEQDWFQDIPNPDAGEGDSMALPLTTPLITQDKMNRYTMRSHALEDGQVQVRGREYAQTRFIDTPELFEGVRESLAPRWNRQLTVQQRLEKLQNLKESKQKGLNSASHNDLRRCYKKEFAILEYLIETENVDI